ncbi:hypothetical protein ACIREO_14175 [Streptomyces sp. NPDC102441]|uniref:hypothetical protein n=1 Tax=Streptomyces sp. NPDC102441 TaxID=3366176 RepID=UPI0038272C56
MFAATQMIARLHSEASPVLFPAEMLAEILWVSAADLRAFTGDSLAASQAVDFVRRTAFNHVLLDILDGTGRFDRNG